MSKQFALMGDDCERMKFVLEKNFTSGLQGGCNAIFSRCWSCTFLALVFHISSQFFTSVISDFLGLDPSVPSLKF